MSHASAQVSEDGIPELKSVPVESLDEIVVAIPAVTFDRKRAAIETALDWNDKMKALFLGTKICDSGGMSLEIVEFGQQGSTQREVLESLVASKHAPCSMSDFLALVDCMLDGKRQMHPVCCFGQEIPWGGKMMLPLLAPEKDQKGVAHLRLFEWGSDEAVRHFPKLYVVCKKIR